MNKNTTNALLLTIKLPKIYIKGEKSRLMSGFKNSNKITDASKVLLAQYLVNNEYSTNNGFLSFSWD